MADSKIEWTDATWNPVTGCTRESEGCDNCYAVVMTKRLAAMGQEKYKGLVNLGKNHFNGVIKTHDDALLLPLSWKKPRKVFVNSMSDLFHKGVPFDFIDKVFAVMGLCPRHTFQVLTKRADRMAEYFADPDQPERVYLIASAMPEAEEFKDNEDYYIDFNCLGNVWLGTSVENQAAADERITRLRKCPAAVRFLSCEPLIGPLSNLNLEGIHWLIAGGESGPKARPMHPDWARSLRDQCETTGVPFFFKQWGEWHPRLKEGRWPDGRGGGFATCDHLPTWWVSPRGLEYDAKTGNSAGESLMKRVGKKAAGRLLDGRTWDEFPKDAR